MFGAFLMLAMVAAYAIFRADIIPNGGPQARNCLWLFPGKWGYEFINRDYFDVLIVVLLGFAVMVTWEFLKSKPQRAACFAVAFVGAAMAWAVAMGSQVFFDGITLVWLGWEWTRYEIVCALMFLALLLMWLPPAGRWARTGAFKVKNPVPLAAKTALFRWLAGLCLLTPVLIIFRAHPFYISNYYENWRITISYIYLGYLLLGFPYGFVTNLLRNSRGEDRKDAGFLAMLFFRAVFRRIKGRKDSLRRVMKNKSTLVVLRDLGVKFFFVPLMTTFLFVECGGFFSNFPQFLKQLTEVLTNSGQYFGGAGIEGFIALSGMFDRFYFSAFHAIFVMDVSLSLTGYVFSLRWLNNKSKSVDPSVTGWLAAIICYPPFNGITTNYLPYNRGYGDSPYLMQLATATASLNPDAPAVFMGMMDFTLKTITLLAFTVYVWATMAFGLRFSNLTNRGILARGPYAFIRHPAYISKNFAWWAENIRNFASPWQFVFLAVWNYIYYLRALTEERHLLKDPDYVAYKKQVKYRFIPGVW